MTDRPQSMVETLSDQDIHQLLVPTPTTESPVRPRDSSSNSSLPSSDAGSFFVPEPLSRSNSVYSFSRASLSSQLSSLTSMSLPRAESLAASITALPTAKKAVRALNSAAEQIMSWTKKALKVLQTLDADDDVEWAAAAGRDALDDTHATVNKFETLISVYVVSIEELQARSDIGDLRHEHLSAVVEQMETTLYSWETVRQNLKRLHEQVELAMEWEELWNTVLADVACELDSLSQLVFEMEEKRHKAYIAQTPTEPAQNFDLRELENMMDEQPMAKSKVPAANPRFSMSFENTALKPPPIEQSQDDSDLLALFARMQPLRASLDFLPMRLSVWQDRAQEVFPSACKELDEKCKRVEKDWQRLSEDAETLRRELSEDRWVVVFRNAGRQAQKMLESVGRSVYKVQEALGEGFQQSNPTALNKRLESCEAKRLHYMPAVQRVLTIIQKGLKDRLTVNGEILRLHRDLSTKMRDLEDLMTSLTSQHEASQNPRKMRESMYGIMSAASHSIGTGARAGTPGSSPASSVDLNTPQKLSRPVSKYGMNGYSKPRAVSSNRGPPLASNNRRASMQSLRPTTPSGLRRGLSPGPPSIYRQGVYKPTTVQASQRHSTPPVEKPRFSAVISQGEADRVSGYARPASTTPMSGRFTPRSFLSSSLPASDFRSPLSREATSSPIPLRSRDSMQLKSFAERVASPSPVRSSLMGPVPYHRSRNINVPEIGAVRSPSSMAVRSNQQATISNGLSSTAIPIRPHSSLSRSVGPTGRNGGIPVRVGIESPNPKHHTPRSSLDSGRSVATSGPGHTDYYASSTNENDLDLEDDASTEHGSHGSSPLNNRKAGGRPSSSLSGSVKGRRTSMLPVPVGSGRLSSMGLHST